MLASVLTQSDNTVGAGGVTRTPNESKNKDVQLKPGHMGDIEQSEPRRSSRVKPTKPPEPLTLPLKRPQPTKGNGKKTKKKQIGKVISGTRPSRSSSATPAIPIVVPPNYEVIDLTVDEVCPIKIMIYVLIPC